MEEKNGMGYPQQMYDMDQERIAWSASAALDATSSPGSKNAVWWVDGY
jgi:hypothetical protein